MRTLVLSVIYPRTIQDSVYLALLCLSAASSKLWENCSPVSCLSAFHMSFGLLNANTLHLITYLFVCVIEALFLAILEVALLLTSQAI